MLILHKGTSLFFAFCFTGEAEANTKLSRTTRPLSHLFVISSLSISAWTPLKGTLTNSLRQSVVSSHMTRPAGLWREWVDCVLQLWRPFSVQSLVSLSMQGIWISFLGHLFSITSILLSLSAGWDHVCHHTLDLYRLYCRQNRMVLLHQLGHGRCRDRDACVHRRAGTFRKVGSRVHEAVLSPSCTPFVKIYVAALLI